MQKQDILEFLSETNVLRSLATSILVKCQFVGTNYTAVRRPCAQLLQCIEPDI